VGAKVYVIGAGLAGSEAAYTAARLGVPVTLFEMRPVKMTPAHQTGRFAELVCSNSLGGEQPAHAKGLLQAELRCAASVVMQAADTARVPAGSALAVDREIFSETVTNALHAHPNIEIVRQEVTKIPSDGWVVLATGPLTSDALAQSLKGLLGGENFLNYYDAASPIVLGESINYQVCYRRGRFEQPEDYLNCPLTAEDYKRLHEAILQARRHVPHEWEHLEYFEGCVPIEELARRGYLTLRFGPLRPVGLPDPRTGEEPFAVVQLRAEDRQERLWSLVGFQTGLKWPDQKLVIQTIPGLEEAEIVRYGVMHRNTYLNAPALLDPTLQLRRYPRLLVAGVLAGVEGYLESAATGWLAGLNAARLALGLAPVVPPERSMLGGLVRFLAMANPANFQPMNANWGLVLPMEGRGDKRHRRAQMYERGLQAFSEWLDSLGHLAMPAPSGGALTSTPS
jgi:methylenetetrahydrofolate--tRNA-(uracil-5-)-methyltransferase